jgi:hypothetical protein
MPGLNIDDHIADTPQAPLNARTNHVFTQIHAINGVISSDQTGRFPITSNRGNAYVVVFYIYDANYICSIPIKSRSKEELLRAYHEVYEWLSVQGFKPLLHKMDNKTSHEVEKFIQGQQTRFQYTPPDMHCSNRTGDMHLEKSLPHGHRRPPEVLPHCKLVPPHQAV